MSFVISKFKSVYTYFSSPHRKLYDSNRSTVSFVKAFCNQLPFGRLLCSLVLRGVYESLVKVYEYYS